MKKLGMKEISAIVSITVFTILIAVVIIILNFSRNTPPVDPLKETTRIGLVLNGRADDESWNSSHYRALMSISDDLNLDVIVRENVPADGNCLLTIRELVQQQDCFVVIAASPDYEDSIVQAASEFPDRYFLHASGTVSGRNLGSFFGRMYQIRYLSGIVAGLSSESGSIGFVAAFPISEVNRGINAFALGVRSVAPDAVVHVKFAGSWTDEELAARASRELIDDYGTDVLTSHVNNTAPLRTADERGIKSVGYNCDNTDQFPDSCITACVWRWDGYYREQILDCIQGKFRGVNSFLGYDSGAMELVDPDRNGKAAEGCAEAIISAAERFDDYSFDVFYGPVTDNNGVVRVPEGESMSDESMLNNFYWYVEGVEIDS